MSARVLLRDKLVGELRLHSGSQQTVFEFDATYAASASRPVLGRWFEDKMIGLRTTFPGAPLPNFFRNLLPEGALRKIIERRIGAPANPEYAMLLRLGENLPGAVRVLEARDDVVADPLGAQERAGRDSADPYRFALTGVQPKLALSENDDRLTLPVEGAQGHWIAKFGSPAFQRLVDNECLMLDWAQRCGLDVPEHRVIRARDVENLPADFDADQDVLIIRRFDRKEGGGRIHQEDFAQVFDLPPEERYAWEAADRGWANYGSVGAVIFAVCGDADFRRYMRRLAFMVLSGNADAHLKNWSLVYPDGLTPRLSPLYDVVATVVYPSLRAHAGLRWVEPPVPTLDPPRPLVDATLDDLLAAASYSSADTAEVMDDLEEFARRARETWPDVSARSPEVLRERVAAHLAASPFGR